MGHFSFFPAVWNGCAFHFKIMDYKYVNTMLVLFHFVCYIINVFSLPARQKEARDITYHVIPATEEAKKDETAV